MQKGSAIAPADLYKIAQLICVICVKRTRLGHLTRSRQALPGPSHTTIKSFPTMIPPLKYFAAGAGQVSLVMLSKAGIRCEYEE
jgi:hypothetical protein